MKQDLFLALGHKATHQLGRCDYQTEPDILKLDKLFKLYNRYYLRKSNKCNSRDFFRSKQTDTQTPDDYRRNLIELQKE